MVPAQNILGQVVSSNYSVGPLVLIKTNFWINRRINQTKSIEPSPNPQS